MQMQALWDRIEAWLMMNAPEEMFSLQPGATDQDIREAETAMGIELPDEVRASYRIHNGGALIAEPLDDTFWELLCLEDMVRDWKTYRGFDHGLRAPIQPEDKVRPQGWHLHWIPLLEDHNRTGQCLCLDLAPGPAGQKGQILEVEWEDPGQRPVIVASFQALLSTFADHLEAGKYMWNEDDGTLDIAQPPL